MIRDILPFLHRVFAVTLVVILEIALYKQSAFSVLCKHVSLSFLDGKINGAKYGVLTDTNGISNRKLEIRVLDKTNFFSREDTIYVRKISSGKILSIDRKRVL